MQRQAQFDENLKAALISKAEEINPPSDMWDRIKTALSQNEDAMPMKTRPINSFQLTWKAALVGAVCVILFVNVLTLRFLPQAQAKMLGALNSVVAVIQEVMVQIQGETFGDYSQPEGVVVSGTWGKEAGQFGISPEGASMGPGSFAVDKAGSVFIIDQINKRVQIFDAQGRLTSAFPIESKAADYIAVNSSRTVYVTDTNVSRQLYIYSSVGRLIDKGPISPSLAILNVFTRGDGVFAVNDFDQGVYRLATGGKVLAQVEQNRMRASGVWQGDLDSTIKLFGSKEYETKILIQDEKGEEQVVSNILSQRRMLVDGLQVDDKGNAYLFGVVLKHAIGKDNNSSQVTVLKIDNNGDYVGEIDIPLIRYCPSWRPYFVSGDGYIYQLQTDKQGLKIVKWAF